MVRHVPLCLIAFFAGCGGLPPDADADGTMLAVFAPLPESYSTERTPVTAERVALGKMLYHDPRLSRNHDVSCATCHPLDRHGVDGLPVSRGHGGQTGTRNAPTVFNAAGQFVQFWDGRAADAEEQAKGPVLNPVEMAMDDAAEVEARLRSAPEYQEAFARAFAGETEPVTFENMARAIGAFERTLVTPCGWDAFLQGDSEALTEEEKAGFRVFVSTGCVTCHRGPLVGGEMYNRLGAVRRWPDTRDPGRYGSTGHPRDHMVFKVPQLRNVAETAPYFHSGSVPTLEAAVEAMADYQLGRTLDPAETAAIVTWLEALTGQWHVR